MGATNIITPNGLIQALNQNIGLKVVEFTFDTAKNDSTGVSNKTVAAHKTGVVLPAHAIIVGGFVDTNTIFTSGNTAATIAIKVEAANDIINAAQINGSPGSALGRKAIIPKASTPESTSVKTTDEREITVTVGTEALTAGKLTGYLYYLQGVASA
jgi:hypothetical protein